MTAKLKELLSASTSEVGQEPEGGGVNLGCFGSFSH